MNMNRKRKLGIAIVAAMLMAGCGDDADTTTAADGVMNSGSESIDRDSGAAGIDAQDLIDNANTTLADRAAEVEDIAIADVFPQEYIDSETDTDDLVMAAATLAPTEGNDNAGIVMFIQEPAGMAEDSLAEQDALETDSASGDAGSAPAMRLVARIDGLSAGPHGFHIHETGDCSADDAASAGGHFNPTEAEHGAPDSEDSHVGDLGNISADAYGVAVHDTRNPKLRFEGANSVIGKAVAVHAGMDDLGTQPSGNSGDIVACGVIEPYRPNAQDISQSN